MKNSNKKFKFNAYAVIVGTILLLYALSVITPLLWGIMTSLKHRVDFSTPGTILNLPNMEIWEKVGGNLFTNYSNLFSDLQIEVAKTYYIGLNLQKEVSLRDTVTLFDFVTNTILYAGGTAFLGAMAPCIMGYLCAKFRYKFCNFIYGFVLFVMVMPIVGNTTAVITLMRRFGMYNTIWGMCIKGCTFANTYFLIFYAFFSGVSDTYAEAAQLDGASYFRVMWTIYIPLAVKTVTTVFLLLFVAHYNDYNTSLLYIPTRPTLAYAVWYFSRGMGGKAENPPFNFAASMSLALPMVILFAVFKKKLMGDISVGGIKE